MWVFARVYVIFMRVEAVHAHILPLDLKPANVLLDNDMTPKIADFGQSRLFGEGQTHTANVVGTLREKNS